MSDDDVIAGRYELLRPISAGIAQVWVAQDRALDRRVVLKLLVEREASSALSDRFKREAEVMLRLRHLRIPEIYDSGAGVNRLGKRVYYIAMESIKGAPINDLIDRLGNLPAHQAAALADSIAEILQGVHSAGFVHRDIKPSNVLLDDSGLATLIDFGLAYSVGKPVQLAEVGEGITGSPLYMAPEQVSDIPVEFSADVYSLGVVLYELLTGRVPFGADGSVYEILRKKVTEIPEHPSDLRPEVPEGLAALVMAMLDRHPKDRPELAEVRELLKPFLPAHGWIPAKPLAWDSGGLEGWRSEPAVHLPVAETTLVGSRARTGASYGSWAGESSISGTRDGTAERWGDRSALRELRYRASLLWQGKRQNIRDASDLDEARAGFMGEGEDIEAAHDNIDSALGRLFMRLGPPPEPASGDFVNLGSDGGGARR
ncbi:serine/threonine-protein kinase [Kitasatospora sp. NPDC058190]|uniref:serine/threonine-protein kinase n=1 Tax=Kitasatospora sp. NPDC058190 TaxID=3346371 RepID=UPI0036D85EC6